MQQGNPLSLVSNWLLTIGTFTLMLGAIGQARNEMLEYRRFFSAVPQAADSLLVALPFGGLIARSRGLWKAVLIIIDTIMMILASLPMLLNLSWYFLVQIPKEIARIRDAQGQDADDIAKAGRSARMWFVIFLGSLAATIGAALALADFYNGSLPAQRRTSARATPQKGASWPGGKA